MIKSFEGIRGLAAVLVTLYHFGVAWYIRPIEYGYLFVDLFFVLSGFVIAANYSSRMAKSSDLKSFLIRRFGRLFPLMIFSTILFVIAFDGGILAKRTIVAMGYTNIFKNPGALSYLVPTIPEIVGSVFFVQGMGFFDKQILNYVSWSISAEFYTYILFAIVLMAVKGLFRTAFAVLLAASGVVITGWASYSLHDCLQTHNCYAVTYDFGFARCVGSFFLGMLTCQVAPKMIVSRTKLQVLALVSVLAFFALVRSVPLITFGFPLVCALLIISISTDRGFLAEIFNLRLFQILGQRSFSIYMLHPVVLLLLGPLPTVINNTVHPVKNTIFTIAGISIYLAVIVVVAGWSYSRIESPYRAWFNRLADRVQAGASPSTGHDSQEQVSEATVQ
jgi:peptidoglycan/LPS O-acetylase OafA/YrhL